MAIRFFIKKFPKIKQEIKKDKPVETKTTENKNKRNKKKVDMCLEMEDKIKQAEDTLNNMEPEVKVIKKDKSIIERTEASKIVLVEDNRQLLVD